MTDTSTRLQAALEAMSAAQPPRYRGFGSLPADQGPRILGAVGASVRDGRPHAVYLVEGRAYATRWRVEIPLAPGALERGLLAVAENDCWGMHLAGVIQTDCLADELA